METTTATLLPFVLNILNRKPDMCDTYKNLQNEIKKTFAITNPNALDETLNVGHSLGIITLTDDLVSVPFNYGASHLKAQKKKSRRRGSRRSVSRGGSRSGSRSRRRRSRSRRR